ncbi:proto-oncogene serine/threonine-protein kinase mos [Corythoichthys intestinalis]|uniref:proto-oncogene serine/threonine-protein kinase mos n=1 Tax=Corythoichthys intestinalis TaxID=161448 RepID=UPI0025A6647D|nr:proto-oncogene serine/threonine-protein kinase mos [Corythoichthys intestinalis]XP_061809894.1 proto-oncogene serine/threonine-protein kinase mos [Nerophis lumbriciformis]
MPSPVPPTRFLPKDIYPSVDIGTCSSPLSKHSFGSTLQVPTQRLQGKVTSRLWSSVIYWKELHCVQPIGSGGFGSVYKAKYLGETVALKKVKKCTKNKLASRQSFWAELNAAHLRHRNVVRVIAATTCMPTDFGDESSIGTIMMEYVGKRNLHQIIYGCVEEPLAPDRWITCSLDIAHGLQFLHSHMIMHLDIKPANVLVSSEDECKIADFGCSVQLNTKREASDVVPLSHAGGTYTHRAPELLKGEEISDKSDIFSFGITMWQLMTREQPYLGDRQHVIYAVVAQNLRPKVEDQAIFQSEQGRDCKTLLSRCWAADSQCRFSAQELITQLENLRAKL